MFFGSQGTWNCSRVGHVGIFFRHLGSQLWVLGPTWVQVGRLSAILAPNWGFLKPSWLQVGSKITIFRRSKNRSIISSNNLWFNWRYPDPTPSQPLADIAAAAHGSNGLTYCHSIQRFVYRDLIDSDSVCAGLI